MDRAAELRKDFDLLGKLLLGTEGKDAAAIVRERRILGAELDRLERTGEVSLVDQLAAKRARAGSKRPSARRSKSG